MSQNRHVSSNFKKLKHWEKKIQFISVSRNPYPENLHPCRYLLRTKKKKHHKYRYLSVHLYRKEKRKIQILHLYKYSLNTKTAQVRWDNTFMWSHTDKGAHRNRAFQPAKAMSCLHDLGTSCWLFPRHVLLKKASVWAKLEAHYRIQCSWKTPMPPALMLGQCRCTWCTCLRGDYLNKQHWIKSCSKQH